MANYIPEKDFDFIEGLNLIRFKAGVAKEVPDRILSLLPPGASGETPPAAAQKATPLEGIMGDLTDDQLIELSAAVQEILDLEDSKLLTANNVPRTAELRKRVTFDFSRADITRALELTV